LLALAEDHAPGLGLSEIRLYTSEAMTRTSPTNGTHFISPRARLSNMDRPQKWVTLSCIQSVEPNNEFECMVYEQARLRIGDVCTKLAK